VGIAPAFGEIPKGLVEREGRLPLAFRAFHSPGISTALRYVRNRPGHPAKPQDPRETMPPAIHPLGPAYPARCLLSLRFSRFKRVAVTNLRSYLEFPA
jgi:hypothetical protein